MVISEKAVYNITSAPDYNYVKYVCMWKNTGKGYKK